MISTESTLIAVFITLVLLIGPGCDSETAKNEQNEMIDAQTLNSRICPALTIEESLGVAYMHPEALERDWHLCKKVDPSVVPQIMAILQDKTKSRHWPSAAESLAFVGQDPEALLLIETMKQGEIPPDPVDPHLVRHFYRSSMLALGLMARRNIPEAKKVAAQFCEQEFWGSIPDHGHPFFILDMRVKPYMPRHSQTGISILSCTNAYVRTRIPLQRILMKQRSKISCVGWTNRRTLVSAARTAKHSCTATTPP